MSNDQNVWLHSFTCRMAFAPPTASNTRVHACQELLECLSHNSVILGY